MASRSDNDNDDDNFFNTEECNNLKKKDQIEDTSEKKNPFYRC